MATVQEWFNAEYGTDKDETYEIILDNSGRDEKIEGELVIEDFPELQEVKIAGEPTNQGGLTKLTVKNCPELTRLDCSNNNISEFIVTGCPKLDDLDVSSQYKKDSTVNSLNGIEIGKIGHNLRKINVSDNNLKDLDFLSGNNPQLIEIKCSGNLLKKLDVSGFRNLKKLYCGGNLLSSLNLMTNLELEELYIENNNFPEHYLSFLSHLKKLKELSLGNRKDISQGIYNRFNGSLEHLKKMRKLEKLNISGTNIDDSDRKGLPKTLVIIREQIE
jgi:Leucine-rich repeat (LRR) protein